MHHPNNMRNINLSVIIHSQLLLIHYKIFMYILNIRILNNVCLNVIFIYYLFFMINFTIIYLFCYNYNIYDDKIITSYRYNGYNIYSIKIYN